MKVGLLIVAVLKFHNPVAITHYLTQTQMLMCALYVSLSDNLYQMASQLECVTWNQMNSLASSMKR